MVRPNRSARVVASSCAAAIAVLIPFAVLGIIVALGVNLPYWDEWKYAHLLYLSHQGTLTFADLWHQHNEHRIFLNTVLFLALAKIGGWNVVREQCVSLAVLVATQAVLWSLIRRTVAQSYAAAAFLLVSIVLYSLGQVESLSWGFQMAWFICNLCLVLAVQLLTDDHADTRRYAAAIAVATIASFTMSQGLIVWVAGFICIVARPGRVPRAIVWSACGALVTAVVRYGIAPNANVPHAGGAAHLAALAQFVPAYLGSPLAASFGTGAATAAGTIELALLAAVLVADLRSPQRARAFAARLPWYAIAAYAIVAAMLTSFGRAAFGMHEALESRYTTVAGMLAVAVIGALATQLENAAPRARALASVVAAAVLLGVAVQSANGLRAWQNVAVSRHADVELLARGELIGNDIHWDPRQLNVLLRELRESRDGIYAR